MQTQHCVLNYLIELYQSNLAEGEIITYDLGGNASTSEVGTAIADRCAVILKETF